ncbi:MAG: aminopeptidase [Chlamydiia bacterium]|nr:aminopeptidase [Chlamydiia bacterium]
MLDPRITQLAELLVHHSMKVEASNRVLVEAIDVPQEFTCEVIRLVREAGGYPFVNLRNSTVNRTLIEHGTKEYWEEVAAFERGVMERMDCYIGARGSNNVSEMSGLPVEKQRLYEQTIWTKVHKEVRVPSTRWVILRWPTPAMAQLAEMSTRAFEDFFFSVCTLDYPKMSRAMEPLVKLMEKTSEVRLLGPGRTDLTFSIEGIPTIPCYGLRNIPDGEVFTAPVRDSINGIIAFNTPTLYRGETHTDVTLRFERGKVVEATSSQTDKLNEVLDSDEGARYVGEFAIGCNPHCVRPMKDILFDEKMAGSIHLTPGSCYKEASNGNTSSIHWDLVLRQTPEVGGGEMYFDGVLVRKDGRFVLEELFGLNPESLLGR